MVNVISYNINEMLLELNSSFYQWAYGKIVLLDVVLFKVTEPKDDVKWGLTVHKIVYVISILFKEFLYRETSTETRKQNISRNSGTHPMPPGHYRLPAPE